MIRSRRLLFLVTTAALSACARDATEILRAANFRGGLIVHLGCGGAAAGSQDAGTLTVALHAAPGTAVLGVDRDSANIAAVRAAAMRAGLAGAVTAEELSGSQLPLVANLASLLVVSDASGIERTEMLRVVAPGGVLLTRADGRWENVVKPRPATIDEWTHYLRDASNNAVARDTVVGPPRHTQWLSGPLWTRTHHKLNAISSVVTANGRLFTLADLATAATTAVPGDWNLIARDAFSGVELWRKPVTDWASYGFRFRSGPAQLPRLLIAAGDRLYAPLALNAPVSVLDAATGRTLATCEGTVGAEEMVLAGQTLLVLTGAPVAEQAFGHPAWRDKVELPNRKTVVAIDANSGSPRWRWSPAAGTVRAETLGADEQRAYLQVDEAVICLDLASGAERWGYGTRAEAAPAQPRNKKSRPPKKITYGKHVLVVSDGVVLCKLAGKLVALDAGNGKRLWETTGGAGFHAPPDVFVIDGLVWQGSHPRDSVAPPPTEDFSVARDLRTGKVSRENSVFVDIQSAGHHHRCYRNKATTRYIIGGKRGVEMMDLLGSNHSRANWTRGTCQYGVMPANGLVYAPPHSCGCYMESKLYGFWAFSAEQPAVRAARQAATQLARLRKGAAYGTKSVAASMEGAWPQLRGSALRSGVATTVLPAELKRTWTVRLGGALTQAVAAGDRVVAATVDAGIVHCLDAATGRIAWQYAAGSRVDSAPALYRGLVLFGSADGRVTCLRLSDGEVVWTFLAAPAHMNTVAFDQVESLWPVHGSVLVLNDVAYVSAGRSTWLDGGIDLYGLDPASGQVVCSTRWESRHPTIGEAKAQQDAKFVQRVSQNVADYRTHLEPDRSDAFSMRGGTKSDVLVSDGTNVFLHQAKFNAKLQRQEDLTRHLFSTSSLLDGTENHRSHWVLGTGDFSLVPVAYSWIANGGGRRSPGMAVPRGLMMAFSGQAIWNVRRRGGKYTLQQMANTPFDLNEKPQPDFRKREPGESDGVKWQQPLAVRPRAILKAGTHLILATAPATIPDSDPAAAYEGRQGGMIWVANATDGAKLAEYLIPAPVRWDGLAAAHGRLFASLTDGTLVCLGAEGDELQQGTTPAAASSKPAARPPAKALPPGHGGPAAPGKPVTPDADGKLVLKPETARATAGLRYQRDRNNLGGWAKPQATCEWKLRNVKAGRYAVEFSYGSTNSGAAYTITAGTASLAGKTVHTGGLKTYKPHKVGTITLPAGEVTLRIQGGKFRGALMNYRLLTLTPTK